MDERNVKRFFAKVDRNGPLHPVLRTRCHLWTASRRRNGYGEVRVKGKLELAHRVAFFIAYGRWPTPQALHKCDNKSCVRSEHLVEGTAKENSADMLQKGRNRVLYGEANGSSKLTDAQVVEARRRFEAGEVNLPELALELGVHKEYLRQILNGRYRKFGSAVVV